MSSENLNAKMKQTKRRSGIIVMVVCVIFFLFIGIVAHKSKPKIKHSSNHTAMVAGAMSDFGESAQETSLENQQVSIDSMKSEIDDLKKQLSSYAQLIKANGSENAQVQEKLMAALAAKNTPPTHKDEFNSNVQQARPISMSTFNFSYHSETEQSKSSKTYVPASTYVGGVLLQGADANASVNGQSATQPILIKLLDNGTLPGGAHSSLKGCRVLASIFGDISSERGEIRLTNLSCMRKNGRILDIPVKGYVSFMGKEGVAGRAVMRNGPVIFWAGLSGLFSGFGSALSQASQTYQATPLGPVSMVSGGQVWQNAGGQGVGTAMGKLSDYYIKRADQYHPIIEVGSGNVVTVVFQSGFFLKNSKNSTNQKSNQGISVESTNDDSIANVPADGSFQNMKVSQNIVDQVKYVHLGDMN